MNLTGRPWRRALAWLAALAPFFYLSYGLANPRAAARATVPSVVFDWERHIPFWQQTIFPYWSVNALYGLSLLLARSRHELDRHALRLLTAQLVAVDPDVRDLQTHPGGDARALARPRPRRRLVIAR